MSWLNTLTVIGSAYLLCVAVVLLANIQQDIRDGHQKPKLRILGELTLGVIGGLLALRAFVISVINAFN
jgi:hypothetical protein